jgi:hypothetical protein
MMNKLKEHTLWLKILISGINCPLLIHTPPPRSVIQQRSYCTDPYSPYSKEEGMKIEGPYSKEEGTKIDGPYSKEERTKIEANYGHEFQSCVECFLLQQGRKDQAVQLTMGTIFKVLIWRRS